ncbi:MAG: M1 family metallopeptidase, partial [Candidatus Latescibacteria bacterium]|nr:M1 family metallopeptidase [Candidatus Latescibacterota bacterium]
NAFRDKNVPYQVDESRKYNFRLRDVPDAHKGWLDLSDLAVDGTPVTHTVDGTLAHFALPRGLTPRDSMTITLSFDGKVRKAIDRSGYRGHHYDMAQWYPKIVVYDENGFHPDQFEEGEFYGEFGTFDVHIELPDHFVVAATGVVQAGDPGWDYNPAKNPKAPKRPVTGNTKTVHFHAENVHDFAWCTDPTYVVEDTTINDVNIYSVYRRASAKTWQDSTLVHAIRAIRWLEKKVGKYPYPQITVAEWLRQGGMEYPMFVMDGRASEGLAFHEIGHVYFFGLLANDEREEAWMDEGFTVFQTRWYQDQRYGAWGDKRQWNWYQRMTPQYKQWEDARRQVFDLDRRGYGERASFRAEKYDHSYRTNVYTKASLVVRAIQYAAGPENFERILQTYFDRWQLKHVNEERFRLVCEEVAQRDLSRQFEQWLHTKKTVDYKLESARSRADSTGATTEVVIKRIGELYLPIEVHFTMPDGSVEKKRFDARDREIRERVKLPAVPVKVDINPDNEIMDIDRSNNVHPKQRDFQVDWPNNYYYPEDAYQIRHRPAIWYNDVDGAKVGYHLFGSLHGWKRRINLGVYYGAKSEQWDYSGSYETPKRWLNTNTTLRLSGYRMEGRADARIEVAFKKRGKLIEPPTQDITFGYGYHELRDAAYLTSTEIYDTSLADVGPYVSYAVDPQLDIMSTRLAIDFNLGRDWFAGNTDYERIAMLATFHSRPEVVRLDARLRLFGGFAGGGVPTQRKFNLAGGGPMKQEERFWLRAPGAVPQDLNYVEPGDGNLRGYAAGTFGVNKLLAVNAELGTKLKLFGLEKPLAKLVGTTSWYGFYDVGWILDSENPLQDSPRVTSLVDGGVLNARLENAGVGIRSHVAWPFWNFTWRLDVPFWVSHSDVNGEADYVDFRYLFSLNASF